MEAPENAYAVIIAGGSGTRLWPKSRKKTPKHLLNLFGSGSLLKLTLERVSSVIPEERILIVTHKDHVSTIKDQLPKFPEKNIIAEPKARGTAMAMAVAAAVVGIRDESAVIFNLWADQMFEGLEKFHRTILASLETAAKGDYLVAIGVRPTFPHTGLGYIKTGDQLERIKISGKDVFVFKSRGFKEKPDLSTAQSFLASGQYLWNTGLYCWSFKSIFQAFETHSETIFKAMKKIMDNGSLENIYEEVGNPDSIDYEVSEKASNILVIPGDFGWSDVGDWKVVYDTLKKDSSGNVVVEGGTEHINIGSTNLLVEAPKKLVVTIGVDNLVIVDTGDTLLVCKKDKAQDVKKAVEKLKADNRDEFL